MRRIYRSYRRSKGSRRKRSTEYVEAEEVSTNRRICRKEKVVDEEEKVEEREEIEEAEEIIYIDSSIEQKLLLRKFLYAINSISLHQILWCFLDKSTQQVTAMFEMWLLLLILHCT